MMLRKVCDICGRDITDDVIVVKDERELYTKCNPQTIGITCPRDCDWDLCPSCREKLYSWVQEQRAAAKESFEAEDKEWGTMEERCCDKVPSTLGRGVKGLSLGEKQYRILRKVFKK
ncbi:MAG: hypothetical protein K5659_09040 [Lachnospiraceae bacterium]|nr:hypothetical protein [Lachnospiraceae bacterium]